MQDGCKACPNGTYSSRLNTQRDFYKCPNASSPRLSSLLPTPSPYCANDTVTVGAASCSPCPADRPYTWSSGSTSISACVLCPKEQYMDPVTRRCTRCVDPCSPETHYEVSPCTPNSKRQCGLCNRQCNGADEYVLQVSTPLFLHWFFSKDAKLTQ